MSARLLAMLALCMSCGLAREHRAAPALPAFAFEPPRAWQSKSPGVPPVQPPEPSEETWRVLVSQNRPLQSKTPHWQAVPATRTVELEMPEASVFSCVVPPLQITSESNTFGTRLDAWNLARSLRCSADGFRTWTEAVHHARRLPDGTRESGPNTGVLLRERAGDGSAREISVLLRSDPERRDATTGPPRIVEGVPVD